MLAGELRVQCPLVAKEATNLFVGCLFLKREDTKTAMGTPNSGTSTDPPVSGLLNHNVSSINSSRTASNFSDCFSHRRNVEYFGHPDSSGGVHRQSWGPGLWCQGRCQDWCCGRCLVDQSSLSMWVRTQIVNNRSVVHTLRGDCSWGKFPDPGSFTSVDWTSLIKIFFLRFDLHRVSVCVFHSRSPTCACCPKIAQFFPFRWTKVFFGRNFFTVGLCVLLLSQDGLHEDSTPTQMTCFLCVHSSVRNADRQCHGSVGCPVRNHRQCGGVGRGLSRLRPAHRVPDASSPRHEQR